MSCINQFVPDIKEIVTKFVPDNDRDKAAYFKAWYTYIMQVITQLQVGPGILEHSYRHTVIGYTWTFRASSYSSSLLWVGLDFMTFAVMEKGRKEIF